MSRLENLIYRFQVQKSHLDRAVRYCSDQKGIVLEIGLGSGRSFDHLREKMSERDIFAFDHRVETHPGCEPAEHERVLGEVMETLPQFAQEHKDQAALIHIDVGSKKFEQDIDRYKSYLPSLKKLLKMGSVIVSDRPFDDPDLLPLPEVEENKNWRYFSYIKSQ